MSRLARPCDVTRCLPSLKQELTLLGGGMRKICWFLRHAEFGLSWVLYGVSSLMNRRTIRLYTHWDINTSVYHHVDHYTFYPLLHNSVQKRMIT